MRRNDSFRITTGFNKWLVDERRPCLVTKMRPPTREYPHYAPQGGKLMAKTSAHSTDLRMNRREPLRAGWVRGHNHANIERKLPMGGLPSRSKVILLQYAKAA